jgi:hypothetical protein
MEPYCPRSMRPIGYTEPTSVHLFTCSHTCGCRSPYDPSEWVRYRDRSLMHLKAHQAQLGNGPLSEHPRCNAHCQYQASIRHQRERARHKHQHHQHRPTSAHSHSSRHKDHHNTSAQHRPLQPAASPYDSDKTSLLPSASSMPPLEDPDKTLLLPPYSMPPLESGSMPALEPVSCNQSITALNQHHSNTTIKHHSSTSSSSHSRHRQHYQRVLSDVTNIQSASTADELLELLE